MRTTRYKGVIIQNPRYRVKYVGMVLIVRLLKTLKKGKATLSKVINEEDSSAEINTYKI